MSVDIGELRLCSGVEAGSRRRGGPVCVSSERGEKRNSEKVKLVNMLVSLLHSSLSLLFLTCNKRKKEKVSAKCSQMS